MQYNVHMTSEIQHAIHSLVKDITYKPHVRLDMFLELDPHTQAHVIMRLSRHVQRQIMVRLHNDHILSLSKHLEPDDITDLLQLLSPRRQREVLELMSAELQDTLADLLKFTPKTAAGLMNLNYILVRPEEKLTDIVESVQKHEKRTGKLPTPLVIEGESLRGQVMLQELLFAKPSEYVKDHIQPIKSIQASTQSEEVRDFLIDHPHERVAVLGDDGDVLGVLFSDDVLREIEHKETSSLYDFAGLNAEESVDDSVDVKVGNRYKWLITNLATAFFASYVVGLFEATISKYVLLAVYMPIVAGMGGNAATQTLAVLVRGISQGQIDIHNALPTLRREVGAGIINGCINGLIVFAVVMLVNKDIKVAMILAMAMVINLVVAGTFGTIVPLIMKRLGKDPATSATIFITTATDVLGFLAFLGLATVVLSS